MNFESKCKDAEEETMWNGVGIFIVWVIGLTYIISHWKILGG